MHQQPRAAGRQPTTIPSDPIPGESSRWLERFTAYCQAGPTRSLIATYNAERAADGKTAAGNLPGSWTAAAAKFRWVQRAQDFDRRSHEAEEAGRLAALKDGAIDRQKLREARRIEVEEAEWAARQQCLDRAKAMLATNLFRQETSRDGKTVKILPARWSFRSAVELLAIAMRLGRMSARMPLAIEAEPLGDLPMEFFETSGQLEAALRPGAVPPMPSDVAVKPPIQSMKAEAGKNGAPSQPPLERPRKKHL